MQPKARKRSVIDFKRVDGVDLSKCNNSTMMSDSQGSSFRSEQRSRLSSPAGAAQVLRSDLSLSFTYTSRRQPCCHKNRVASAQRFPLPTHPEKHLAIFQSKGNTTSVTSAINLPLEPFIPPAHIAEEWDNPAMAEFKREEAEERVAFANSMTQEEWRAALKQSAFRGDFAISVVKTPRRFPFKPVQLPW